MTTKPPNIHQRIASVMKDVAYIQKEDKKVNNQYRFVSHDAVTAKVRPALIEHGVIVEPSVVSHTREGNFTSAEMDVSFVNVDDPKDRITIKTFGYGVDNQDKGPGKAMSYAYKYALLKALALETGDDPERDNIEANEEFGKYTDDEKAQLDQLIKDNNALGLHAYLKVLPQTTSMALLGSFPRGQKGKMSALINELTTKGFSLASDYVVKLNEAKDDDETLTLWDELSELEKKYIWGLITPEAQHYIRKLKEAAA